MRPRVRRPVGFLACLGYFVLAIAVPIVHAETEVVEAAARVESGHTSTCPVVHTEVACTGGAVQAVVPSPLPRLSATDRPIYPPTSYAVAPVHTTTDNAHLVRAPPSVDR